MKLKSLIKEDNFNIPVYHYTTKKSKDDILHNGFDIKKSVANRLIPNSISFSPNNASVFGRSKVNAILNPKKVLYIAISGKLKDDYKDFFDFGKEEDTPANRGIEIYKYAKQNGYDLIVLKGVPGAGIEYAVLDKKIININDEDTR
jgi:hypothetical protein